MWHDNETAVDFLNFTGVADTVAEIVFQAAGRPISIGVSGSWGSGKSSMMRLVRVAMEKRQKADGRKLVIVDFNAWLYQGFDDARAALLEELASALRKTEVANEKVVSKVKSFLKRVNWLRVAKFAAVTAGSLALGIPPVGVAGDVIDVVKKVANGGLSALGKEETDKVAGAAETAKGLISNQPEVESPPQAIRAIRDEFEEILEETKVTLVVLIDDLDRCLPETTISTLEAIRLFLFLKNTAFVIAADTEMVRHAVRKHFEGVDDELLTSYFDKLIQVPIRVPALGIQEVRAYLILLYVDASTLQSTDKDKVREAVAKQLRGSWKGLRVDRRFIESLAKGLPKELVAQCDMADRLAPVLAKAAGLRANPRLIKRFLNAMSIRLAIGRAQGVGMDESALAKVLLLERCARPSVYQEFVQAVAADENGSPGLLAEWEEAVALGNPPKLSGEWEDPFIREWLGIPPALSKLDLRGVLYVSREHSPMLTSDAALTSRGADVLDALLKEPGLARQAQKEIKALSPADLEIVLDRLLVKARQEQEWGVPPILEACLEVVDASAGLGARLGRFLIDRPVDQIQPSIVPKIKGKAWARDVFDAWKTAGVAAAVKRAMERA